MTKEQLLETIKSFSITTSLEELLKIFNIKENQLHKTLKDFNIDYFIEEDKIHLKEKL